MNATAPQVSMFPPPDLLDWAPATARAFLDQIAAAGIDHVCCADHVSFVAGLGFDGLLRATALATLHPSLRISCGLYLLPLRHPVLVARQLADIERLAPGRLSFGVGIGGEDRHEVAICGVDPATRGARMDECLTVLRPLLSGQAVTFHGRFFDMEDALIAPPAPGIPLIVGGRSDAAMRRAGRYGDGWLGIWNSPRRFAAAVEMAAEEAARAGRTAAGPARDAGLVRARGLQGGRPGLPGPGHGSLLPAPLRAVRALLPLRHRRRRGRVPRPVRSGGLHRVQPDPAGTLPDQAVAGVAAVRNLLARTRVPST